MPEKVNKMQETKPERTTISYSTEDLIQKKMLGLAIAAQARKLNTSGEEFFTKRQFNTRKKKNKTAKLSRKKNR